MKDIRPAKKGCFRAKIGLTGQLLTSASRKIISSPVPVINKSDSRLLITCTISDRIVLHSVQLPLLILK